MMIGYDISNEYVQISYYHLEKMEPESISSTIGNEKFQIPFVLCKESNSNIWYYGDEAIKMSIRGKGMLIEDLLRNSVNEKTIELDNKEYRSLELLMLFFRKTFNLIASITAKETFNTIVFTMDYLDERKKYILGKVISDNGLQSAKFSIITYEESFYYYMIYQKKELWNQKVILFNWNKKELCVFHLETNHKTVPKSISVSRTQYNNKELFLELSEKLSEDEKNKKYDDIFLNIIKEQVQKSNISSIYLIGDFYNTGWMNDSLKLLCQGRRVFQGNNLFTKGACYSALEIDKSVAAVNKNKDKIVFISSTNRKTKEFEKIVNCSNEHQKTKLLGDYYLSKNLYHKAILEYEKNINYEEKEYDADTLSCVWSNMGVCFGKLFLFTKALKAFLSSYKIVQNNETGYNIVCVVKLLRKEETDLGFLDDNDKDILLSLDHKFGESVDELFNREIIESKKAMINLAANDRRDGKLGKSYEMLERLLLEWKEEYRSFVMDKKQEID